MSTEDELSVSIQMAELLLIPENRHDLVLGLVQSKFAKIGVDIPDNSFFTFHKTDETNLFKIIVHLQEEKNDNTSNGNTRTLPTTPWHLFSDSDISDIDVL